MKAGMTPSKKPTTNFHVVVQEIFFYHQSMVEREPEDDSEHRTPSIQFGDSLPRGGRRRGQQGEMFSEGDDLPLFSGTPQEVIEHPFEPEDHTWKQAMFPDMPDIDYEHVLELDKHRLKPRTCSPLSHRSFVRQRVNGSKNPGDAAVLLMLEMSHLDQEQMRVVCLNTQNQLQKIHLVYQGSLNAASIRIGEIFKEPLRLNSAAIILAHNHPSGEPLPSPEDVLVTREIVAAGNLLDCEVLDHLVIGQGKWVSMREKGLGFNSR